MRVIEQVVEMGLIVVGLAILCPLVIVLAIIMSLPERPHDSDQNPP